MNRFANVYCVCAHFNGQSNLANHVACVRSNHAAAQNFAVSVRFGAVVKQQLGHAFITAVGYCAAQCVPWEQAFFDLDAFGFGFGFVFGQANPGGFGEPREEAKMRFLDQFGSAVKFKPSKNMDSLLAT